MYQLRVIKELFKRLKEYHREPSSVHVCSRDSEIHRFESRKVFYQYYTACPKVLSQYKLEITIHQIKTRVENLDDDVVFLTFGTKVGPTVSQSASSVFNVYNAFPVRS
jgi:hypothetical protein